MPPTVTETSHQKALSDTAHIKEKAHHSTLHAQIFKNNAYYNGVQKVG